MDKSCAGQRCTPTNIVWKGGLVQNFPDRDQQAEARSTGAWWQKPPLLMWKLNTWVSNGVDFENRHAKGDDPWISPSSNRRRYRLKYWFRLSRHFRQNWARNARTHSFARF